MTTDRPDLDAIRIRAEADEFMGRSCTDTRELLAEVERLRSDVAALTAERDVVDRAVGASAAATMRERAAQTVLELGSDLPRLNLAGEIRALPLLPAGWDTAEDTAAHAAYIGGGPVAEAGVRALPVNEVSHKGCSQPASETPNETPSEQPPAHDMVPNGGTPHGWMCHGCGATTENEPCSQARRELWSNLVAAQSRVAALEATLAEANECPNREHSRRLEALEELTRDQADLLEKHSRDIASAQAAILGVGKSLRDHIRNGVDALKDAQQRL
jgi:hypothetical protein